jgi:integrase
VTRWRSVREAAGERPLSLPAALVRMLAAHLSACRLTAADTGSLVFTSPEGDPLDYSNRRRRVWIPAVRQAGVPSAGFHDLRRTNATQLVAAGVDIKTAQSRLGHADPRLTLAVYAQAVAEADRDAAARLDERFFGQVHTRR